MGDKVEDGIVEIPILADQSPDLGILWNCIGNETSTPSSPIVWKDEEASIQKLPIRSLEYTSNIVKDTTKKNQTLGIGLDIQAKILMLNFPLATVQYDVKYNTKLTKEHVQIYYNRVDCVKRLLPLQTVQDDIKKAYGGTIPGTGPTHVITEAFYGVNLVANVLLESKTTTKMETKSAAGLGALIIGPISTGIEKLLTAVLGAQKDGTTVEIEVLGSHDDENNQIKDIETLFKRLGQLENEKNLKPLKYIGAPIAKFLDLKTEEPKVEIISSFLIPPLNDMVNTLVDIHGPPEPVTRKPKIEFKPEFFMKNIMREDNRLNVILKSAGNELTQKIITMQNEFLESTEELYSEALKIVEGLSTGKTKDDEILNDELILKKLEDFKCKFNVREFEENVTKFAAEGKGILAKVCANDVDQFTKADFVASLADLKAAKEGKPDIYIELNTNSLWGDVPNGLFLLVYNISANLQTFVILPNASNDFSLEIKAKTRSLTLKDSFDQIIMALEILSVAFCGAGGPLGRFYTALASEDGIGFPITSAQFDEKMLQFLENALKEYLVDFKRNVQIFPTCISIKSYIMDEVNENKFILCFPTSSFVSLTQSIKAFLEFYKTVKDKKNHSYEFIAGDFELGEDDAPLIVVFHKGKLKTACLDWLDVLQLHAKIKQPSDIADEEFLDLKSHISTFYPKRTEYYKQLLNIFQFSLYQKSSLVLHPKVLQPLDSDGPAIALRKRVELALNVCSAYLSFGAREQRMVEVLTRILIDTFPEWTTKLEKIGWSSQKKFHSPRIFGDAQRVELRGAYLDILFQGKLISDDSITALVDLGALIHALDYTLQIQPPKTELDKRFEQVNSMWSNGIESSLKTLFTSTKEINDISALFPIDTLGKCSKAYALTQALIPLNTIYDKGSELVQYVQSILSLIPPPPEQEIPEEDSPENNNSLGRFRVETDDYFLKLVQRYVMDTNTELYAILKEYVDRKEILKVVNILNTKLYPDWHTAIAKFTEEKIKHINNHDEVVKLVEEMDNLGMKKDSPLKQHHFVWSNPSLAKLVVGTLNAEGPGGEETYYVKRIFNAIIFKDDLGEEEDHISIPPYIPTSIARELRQYIYNVDDE